MNSCRFCEWCGATSLRAILTTWLLIAAFGAGLVALFGTEGSHRHERTPHQEDLFSETCNGHACR